MSRVPKHQTASPLEDFRPSPQRVAAQSFGLTAVGILIVWALHNVFLGQWEHQAMQASVREPVLLAVRVLAWLLPIALYLRRHEPRAPLRAIGLTTAVHWRGLLLGSLPAIGYLYSIVLLLQMTVEAVAPPSLLETLWQPHVVYVLALVAFEEVLMRGFLLGQLVRFTTSIRAQACVAIVFVLMHFPSWIAPQGLHWGLLPSAIVVLLQGIVLGIIARRSRSIVPAIVVHFANNILAEVLGGS